MLGDGLADAMNGITGMAGGSDVVNLSPSVSEGELAGRIWSEFCRARTERLQRDYEWYVEEQWYNGDTGVFLDKSNGAGTVWRLHNRRPRKTRNLPLNLIGHSIDLLCAKQMRARPTFDASAGNRARMRDRLAAREVRDLVRFLWDKNELTSARRSLFLDRNITGNAFIKVRWNDNMPPFRDNTPTCTACQGGGQAPPHPQMLMQAQQMQQEGLQPPPFPDMGPCPTCNGAGSMPSKRICLGDVAADVVPPWQIWPVAGAMSIEDGCFQAYKITREQAASRFSLPIDQIQASSRLEEGESDFARQAKRYRLNDMDADDVWLIEKWLPPAPKTECPRVVILCGNRVVWPLPDSPDFAQGWTTEGVPRLNRVPFFHFRLRPAAEQFWSNGIVLDMISANDFVNRTRASFHRHQQTMAYTKWLIEEGSVDEDRLVAEEGEVVPFRSHEAPKQSQVSPMPQFYVNIFEMEMDFIPRLAGLQDIDQGKAPPNIEAFQALHFLAEQSETVHGPVYLEDEKQWRQIAWACTRTALFYYKPEDQRLLRIGGSSTEVSALLEGDVTDSVMIRCEIGSALAHSPALRTEMVYRGVEAGVITPQEVRSRGLLDFGIIPGEDEDDHRAQESVAEMENQAIAQGQASGQLQHFMLTSAHDHAVHYEVHRRAALEAQSEGNMQLALLYDAACQQHMALMVPQQPTGPAKPGQGQGKGNPPFDAGQNAGQTQPQVGA